MDNPTKQFIENNDKSDNLLEPGIGNIVLLKDDQKYDYNME